MSLQWFEGFESDWAVSGSEMDGPGGWSVATVGGGGGNGISTSYGRHGSIGARHLNSGGAATMYGEKSGLALGTEFILQCASVWHSSGQSVGIMGAREGATRHLDIWWSSAGNLLIYLNATGTLLATVTGIAAGVYHFIEVKAKISNTGYVIVRVDGVELYNSGTVDTLILAGTGSCDTFWIMNRYAGASGTYHVYWDDFACAAIDGVAPVANPTDWLGDAREVRLNPTGAGNSTQFTPSASTNVSNVDDVSVSDDDTTYNYSSDVGEKDTFVAADVPTPVTVLGVRQKLRARKDDTGVRVARMVRRLSGTDHEGSDLNLLETYQTFHEFLPTKPGGGSWDEASVNGMEIGYKVQS